MIFAEPRLLYLAPVALLLFALGLRLGGARALAASTSRLTRLHVDRRGLSRDSPVRGGRGFGWLFGLAALCCVVALARPQWGVTEEQEFSASRDVLVALDLSRSMLAEDLRPSRLARAKLLVGSLLDELEGERVGLLVFAGTAFLQSPLSSDYEVMRELLDALEPSFLPEGGTNYDAMLAEALRAFASDGEADRFLVVISDGEAHDDTWKRRLDGLREASVQVIGLGIGTARGAVLSDGQGGFVKDARGAAVLSRLSPETLRALADATGGLYRDVGVWADIASLVEQQVAKGRTGRFVEERRQQAVERFQWLLLPAILLFLLALWRELPVAPRPREQVGRGASEAPEARSTQRAAARAAAIATAMALLTASAPEALGQGGTVRREVTRGADGSSDPAASAALTKLVQELLARPAPEAGDFATLAEATVETALSLPPESLPGAVRDGIAATAEGERLDPSAADWSSLRARLMALRPPEPPPGSQGDDAKPGDEGQSDSEPKSGESEGSESESEGAGADGERGEGGEPSAGDAESEPSPADSDAEPSSSSEGQGEQADDASAKDPSMSANREQDGIGAFEEEAPEAGEQGAESEDGEEEGDAAEGGDDSEDPGGGAPQPEPDTRMVGGESGAEPGDLRWANALGRVEDVKDRDAPGLLFQRMNAREAPPTGRAAAPRRETGPDW